MAKKAVGGIEDAYSRLAINDFSGGLNTYASGLNLRSNESPDMLNVIPFPGRLLYRGGYLEYSPTSGAADQEYPFYDSLGHKHLVVWRNGGLVDTITGVEAPIEAAAYNAGQRVGVVDLNGILYWSTQTTHLRFWNPVAGTTGAVVQTGVSPPPASPLLMLYTNAIVAFGVDFAGTYQPTVMSWSVVNAPGNWNAANSQAVGPLTTARLEFALVMGIAEVGVAPFRTFVVGRSDKGLLAYSGALGSLSETLISCPVGCADGASAQFAPSAEKFGCIIFLGTDGQFYSTNGVTCDPISVIYEEGAPRRGIQPTLSAAYADALTTPGNRFWSGYNEAYQYYFCTVAGQQFVYKWDLKAWTLFMGWPVGPSCNFTDLTGLPQIYIAANTPLMVNDVPTFMVAEVGLPNTDDNGTMPVVYYKTPWLHMGDPKKFKEYHWISPQFYAKGSIYQVRGQSLPRAADNSSMNTKPLLFTTPVGVNPYEFQLDVSELDSSDLLGGPGDGGLVGTGNPVVSQARLVCPVDGVGMLAGRNLKLQEILKGSAAQFTVMLYIDSLVCDYELLGLELLWLDRGYMRDGGNLYNPESGVPYGFPGYPPAFDPFLPGSMQNTPKYNTRSGQALSAYSIVGGKLVRQSGNSHIGIFMPEGNFGLAQVYACDNKGNTATLDFPNGGGAGLLLDGNNNAVYSQQTDPGMNGFLWLNSAKLVTGSSSLTGAFAPPAALDYSNGGGYNRDINWYNFGPQSFCFSADKLYFYTLYGNDTTGDVFGILKIRISDGAVIANQFISTLGISPMNITLDSTGTKIIVCASDYNAVPKEIAFYVFAASDLSPTGNSKTAMPNPEPVYGIWTGPDLSTACVSPSKTKCASINVYSNYHATPNNGTYTVFVYDVATNTTTTFPVAVINTSATDYQAAAITFKDDNTILVAIDNTIRQYDLTGGLQATYDFSSLAPPGTIFGAVCMYCVPNTTLVFMCVSPGWIGCFNLATATWLSQSQQPNIDGFGNVFCVVPLV